MSQTTKLIASVVLYITILFPTTIITAQLNPGITAGFGIDGDALSGQSLNISGTTPQGSSDWFRKVGTGSEAGYGVIDTSDAMSMKGIIAGGGNVAFSRGMSTPRYTASNGYLLLDARYGRDYFGFGGAGNNDLTSFSNGAKNGDNPTTWNTVPNGTTVTSKADIIDSYIHLRRNGTTVNNTNPSPLILTMAASTVSSTGDRNIDFEWFRDNVTYSSVTGAFSNTGAAASGGHTLWEFNTDGTVRQLGDITVAYEFGTGGVTNVSVYLWVRETNYNSLVPQKFDFIPNSFVGNNFGYAKIAAKAGAPVSSWAAVSTENTFSTPWGTNSKELGSANNNYASTQYAQFNFSEVALDLTALGIDPALAMGGNTNTAPYKKMLVKTRSSASFTSSLQDFAGPYEFLDAPPQPAVVLPLKFLSFTAIGDDAKVALKWNTTNEVNTSHFEVERSFDASNFKNIGMVLDGFQINATGKSYKFNDNAEELKGKRVAYYRLKQLDNDGKFTYSNVVAVRFENEHGVMVKVFPNPFVERIQMEFIAANTGKAQINIVNLAGQTVATRQALVGKGSNAISVYELDGLKIGIYVAQLSVDGVVIASEKIKKN